MGAGGSTAASCSSLDLASHKQHYRRHQQHHLHEQRMQKYRKQANVLQGAPPKSAKGLAAAKSSGSNLLKQSSHSNFDLSQNHLMHEGRQQQQNIIKLQADWFGGDVGGQRLGDPNHVGPPSRPILVLPNNNGNKPISPVHVISGAKRSNAGVASRLHHLNQRQLNKANELRKFSDSLPSLNNLLDQQQQNHHQPYHHDELISPYAPSPTTSYCLRQENLLSNHKSAKQHHKRQQQFIIQAHRNGGNNNHPKVNLVSSRCDDSSYLDWSSSSAMATANEPQMKRATSLSSLHNSHNNHHLHHLDHHHQQQLQHQKQRLASHMNHGKQSVSHCSASQSHVRKNEISSYHTKNNTTCDLQKQPCNSHPSGYIQQQPIQYNQPTPLAKKILKFKQVAANSGLSSKRYKKKQKQIQQQQQQQGCPVLPPLPRSQSLHELIQLRATENGQRMRTTGTLRGPLGSSGETGNKVNLVVELLESRRQQKMSEQQRQQQITSRDSTETMLSQASSSDDGIHDVSISGGDQSTGDSRCTASSNTNAKYSNDASENGFNNGSNRLSMTSQQEGEKRQGIFNGNHQSSDRTRQRYAGNVNQNQQQLYERPQSQRLTNQVEDSYMRKSIDHQPHKSTLKRSVSHSALHSNLHNLELNNDDEDESDDLNELARFLYQFKQRQQQSKSATGDVSGKPDISANVGDSPPISSNPQQQSPNSTTSSSGFASSTCTSNSISSTASACDEQPAQRTNIEKPATASQADPESSQKKQPGRKKYPAPKRPDDNRPQLQVQQSNSKTEIVSQAIKDQNATPATGNNKNLISGQLKLSSSLLSIVDEYNSTLRANDRGTSPAINGNSSTLTSVLLGEAGITTTSTDKMQMDYNQSPKANRSAADTGRHSFTNANDGSDSSFTSSSPFYHQQHQLEQLRRYTQLRQMSQSELALNHLTSSSGHPKTQIPQVKGKKSSGYDQRINNKPYKSKLINIIRRISDKSEPVVDCSNGAGCHSRLSACSASAVVSASPDPAAAAATITVGGNHITGKAVAATHQVNLKCGGGGAGAGRAAINQTSEMIASYSNQSKQKYNHLEPKLAPQKSLSGGGKSCLSESLCDLNFDCDFELIKNCGNEHKRTVGMPSPPLPGSSGSSSLLASASFDPSRATERCCHNNKDMVAKKQQQQQLHHQPAINLSKGENNWRLVKNPLSLGKQQASLPSRQSLDGAKENGSKGLAKGRMQPVGQAANKLASEQQPQPQVKLKWSASGWLMNSIGAGGGDSCGSSSSSNSNNNRTKGNELLSQRQQQQLRAPASAKEDPGGKSCLSKLISNSGTPSSIAPTSSSTNNNHGGGSFSREQALIESNNKKSFAKVNSEAKQLLNELDHSLDLVSGATGRYPFSRKVPLSGWWKTSTTGSDDYTSSNNGAQHQMIMGVEGKFVHHPDEFGVLSSSSSSLAGSSDSDLDDDDNYASINRAMINATFDVDVNQIKLNDDALSIGPGSPSNSFTFSASNSPVSTNNSEPNTSAPTTKFPIQPTLGQPSGKLEQSKGENHMSKQLICQTNGCLLAGKQQEIYSQIRNSDNNSSGSNGNHAIPSSSSHGMTSHGAGRNGGEDCGSRIKLLYNGNVGCIGANTKRTVSHDDDTCEMGRTKGVGVDKRAVGGKVEPEDATEKKRKKKLGDGGEQLVGSGLMVASGRFHHKDSAGSLAAVGSCMNQDLCAHEQHRAVVVGAKRQQQQSHSRLNESHTTSTTAPSNNDIDDDNNDKNDSHFKLNKMAKCRCCHPERITCNSSPKTTMIGDHNDNDDTSWPNETTNIQPNRLQPSKHQSNGNGKHFSVNGDSQNGCWNQQLHQQQQQHLKSCGHFCNDGSPLKTGDKNGGKNRNPNSTCCCPAKLEGTTKSNGSNSNELLPSAKLASAEEQNVATPHLQAAIQGQQSCVGLGHRKLEVPSLSSCRCCCSSATTTATVAAASTNCAIARDNGYLDHMNGQKQAMAAKCDGQFSSPKEHKLNGSNNVRQMVVVDNLVEPTPEMRSDCNGSSRGNFVGYSGFNGGNGDKKAPVGCWSCSSSLGGGCGGQGKEDTLSELRDLHAVGNGVTYSKTTAPTSEELKNKLITQKQHQRQQKLCHCSSVDGCCGNYFPTTTVTQTGSPHSNDLEISGKTSEATVQQGLSSPSQALRQPLAAGVAAAVDNSNSFSSKPTEMVADSTTERSGFYYYDMDRIYSRQNDKQMIAMDQIVGNQDSRPSNLVEPACCRVSVGGGDDDDEVEMEGGCKVASCLRLHHHHPSSGCSLSGCCNSCASSKTSYNEDVKLKQQQQNACVIRDNLILGAGHGGRLSFASDGTQLKQSPPPPTSSSEDKSFAAEVVAAETSGDAATSDCSHRPDSDNCRCCITQKKQQQHSSEMNGQRLPFGKRFYGVGKFSSPNRTLTTTTNGDLYPPQNPSSKSSPNGRPLCSAGGGVAAVAAVAAASTALSGAPKLICKARVAGKPICRSNSELVPTSSDNKGFLDKARISIGQSSAAPSTTDNHHQREHEHPRLLSKRNSLLNNNGGKMNQATTRAALLACKGSKLASSQVSLANYYNAGGGYFVSPFIAHLDKQHQHRNHHGSTTVLNDQIDVEDNFILKRKTPNAGLKSLC